MGVLTIDFCPIDDYGFLVWCPHCPILVAINVEIRKDIFAPSFFHAEASLHIYEIQEFLFRQGTFASHYVLVRRPRHSLGKRPLTTGYHLS